MNTPEQMAADLAEKFGGVSEGPSARFPGTHGIALARTQLHRWGYRDRFVLALVTAWTHPDLPHARVEALTVTFRAPLTTKSSPRRTR